MIALLLLAALPFMAYSLCLVPSKVKLEFISSYKKETIVVKEKKVEEDLELTEEEIKEIEDEELAIGISSKKKKTEEKSDVNINTKDVKIEDIINI